MQNAITTRRICRIAHKSAGTALGACLLLAGCGGGGGGTNPPPADRAPAFSSAGTGAVDEGVASAFYTAVAADPDGTAITFAINGGADAARFAIDATSGALRFVAAPDFELPTDANADNVYVLTLQATSGGLSASLPLSVTVRDVTSGFASARVGTGFSQPLFLTGTADGTGDVFVVEKAGRVRRLDPDTGTISATDFLNISNDVSTDSERGLLGFALAPDFSTSRQFYVSVTNLAGDSEIRRYRTLVADPSRADTASKDVILTFAQPFSNHNGGWIDFGADQLLYIGSGDGGGGGDPQENGQNPNTLLGKILRIDVRTDAFPADSARDYAIPAGNSFTAGAGAPEIFATGLRNPFRASFDVATGDLYVGDVGQNFIEEIDLIGPNEGGLNFGWDDVEGTRNFEGSAQAGFTLPVAEYPHGSGDRAGNSVTGGVVYRGPVEGLQGQYVFADFVRSNIWSVPAATLRANKTNRATTAAGSFTVLNTQLAPSTGPFSNISSFGTDDAENLYIVDFNGSIYRIVAAN